jgi:hypothetical protein
MRKISLVAMAAAGFVIAMPLAITHAQTAPTDAHRPDATQGTKPMMDPMMGGMMSKMMAEHSNMMMFHHTEGYLAFLKAELQITDAQSAPWTAYVDAVRSVAKKAHEAMPAMPGMAAAPGAPAMPAMPMMAAMSASWPDKLAANEKALTAQLDALKTMRPVVAALYAVLAPDQKKKADELGAGAKGMM